MSEPFFIDGDFSVPVEVGDPRYLPAFPGANAFDILEQDYVQFFDEFTPATINTEHATVSDYYLVDEGPHQDAGCGLIKWTRRYAKVPATRTEYQQHAFTFFGLTPGGIYTSKTMVPEGELAGNIHTLETVAAHGYTVGQFVLIKVGAPYSVDDVSSPYVSIFFTAYREILSVPTTETFTVEAIPGNNPTFIFVTRASEGRDPTTRPVMSKIIHEYFRVAVGETYDDADDIPILEPFTIIDGTGKETLWLGYESLPTQDDYITNTVGDWIIAEHSITTKWAGEIYVRSTRYVRAT